MQENLDIELLRTLVAIADTGSFATAASTVHRTQSAVSMQVKRLEGVVGQPLFEKRGRRTVLNVQGQTLLQHARRILALQDEALTELRGSGMDGEVRLGACDDYVLSFVPPILARYAEVHPNVHVRLDARSSTELIRATAEGDLDIALVNVVDDTIAHEKLATEPLVWVRSPRHLAHEKVPMPLAVERDCAWGTWARRALEGADIAYRNAYSTFNVGGVVAVVDAGLAVGVMTRGSVPPTLEVLAEADGFPPLPTTSLGLVLRAAVPSPAARALADLLRAGIGARAAAA